MTMKTETIMAKDDYTKVKQPKKQHPKTNWLINPAVPLQFSSIKHSSATEVAVLVTTFLVLLLGAAGVYYLQPQLDQLHLNRIATTFGAAFVVLTTGLFLFRAGVFLFHVYLFLKYKPVEAVDDDQLPTCTVIVPAYNEGKLVYDTLMSLVHSDYPQEKLQLLAIDDGSKDDTWEWIQKAKLELGNRVTIFKQPENKGKRHALYRGFNIGTGEVFVTVDSDSIVQRDTLRNLVSPMVLHPDCGAVAGNVAVLNEKEGALPKMLNVSFVMSFEFKRSAESVLVLCTPGALAAYRREAVFACLEEWINQTFNGKPSDIGEDRAMTNMILKQGCKVLFQRNAYVFTNVPEQYAGLYKMFIRWGRSNVREHLMMAKYVFTNFRASGKWGPRLLFLDQSLHFLMMYPLLFFMFFFVANYPLEFLSTTLLSILVVSTFSVGFYAKRYNLYKALWGYTYSLFFSFSLFWIAPYSMATAAKGGWLTREITVKA
jgi:hyaluronan synthase